MNTPLHFSSIANLSSLYKEGHLSPVKVVNECIKRIEELNPKLHAFVKITYEIAERASKLAETELRKGLIRGPLHGIPIGVKDLCDIAGEETNSGSKACNNLKAIRDSTVVKLLKESGAVIVGKLAMTEGAFVEHLDDVPQPVNPWNKDFETGLSSSGSAVAVASGMCWGALGTDTGGSIRFPAISCGIAGLKPTWGRVSRFGITPLASSLDHIGPMARNITDLAAILGVIAGQDNNDLSTYHGRVPDYISGINLGVEGLRIGYDEKYCTEGVNKELSLALKRALDIFSNLGMYIELIELPATETITPNFTDLVSVEAA